MRDEIVKYLGTVMNSTAKTIADRIGVDRTNVALELNAMCRNSILCREKRGEEYIYWLARNNTDASVEKVINTLLPMPVPSVPAEKPEVPRSEDPLDQECAKLRAQIVELEKLRDKQAVELHDLKATAKNQSSKIRELEARCATQASTLSEREAAHESRLERIDALQDERDQFQTELQIVKCERDRLRGNVEDLTLLTAKNQPSHASAAHKIVEAFAATFGYEVVISHELGSIIKPIGKKNDASNDVGSPEAAGIG